MPYDRQKDPTFAKALSRFKLWSGTHEFDRIETIPAGQDEEEENPQYFHYVSFYRHRFATRIFPIGRHVFIAANGFLNSHFYNIALVWASNQQQPNAMKVRYQLAYNYKKYFAELVIEESNVLIGRALLLETLIFEQNLMRPVIEKSREGGPLQDIASKLALQMADITNQHELIHYFLARNREKTLEAIDQIFDGRVRAILMSVRDNHGDHMADEVACDAFAAWQAIAGEHSCLKEYETVERARMTRFAFEVLADLLSMQESARETARLGRAEEARITLGSPIRPKEAFSVATNHHPLFRFRANCVAQLVDDYLERNGLTLFGNEGVFHLPSNFRDQLDVVFETFIDPRVPLDDGLTGTDVSRRQLAQLVAEAFKGHSAGVQHLLWRSKQFNIGGEAVDP